MYRVNGIECDTAEEALKLQEELRMRRVSAEVREEHTKSKEVDSPSLMSSRDPCGYRGCHKPKNHKGKCDNQREIYRKPCSGCGLENCAAPYCGKKGRSEG